MYMCLRLIWETEKSLHVLLARALVMGDINRKASPHLQVNTIWDLAMVLDRQNAPEQALKLFDWANTLDPGNSIILRRRAFCRSKLKDYAGAVEDLEEAVAVSPRNPYLLKDLGFNRWQAGDRSGASEALASANQMLPQDKAIQRLQYSVARYSSKGAAACGIPFGHSWDVDYGHWSAATSCLSGVCNCTDRIRLASSCYAAWPRHSSGDEHVHDIPLHVCIGTSTVMSHAAAP